MKRQYNRDKDMVSESYYDLAGNPVMTAAGYAVRRMDYDGEGRLIRQSTYDTAGNAVIQNDLSAFFIKEYLEDNTVRTTYYDLSGNPVKTLAGYARRDEYYDENFVKTGEAYFDEAGAPQTVGGGIARIDYVQNSDGSTTWNYVNPDGEIIKSEQK